MILLCTEEIPQVNKGSDSRCRNTAKQQMIILNKPQSVKMRSTSTMSVIVTDSEHISNLKEMTQREVDADLN